MVPGALDTGSERITEVEPRSSSAPSLTSITSATSTNQHCRRRHDKQREHRKCIVPKKS